jgi:hypothetical protein
MNPTIINSIYRWGSPYQKTLKGTEGLLSGKYSITKEPMAEILE